MLHGLVEIAGGLPGLHLSALILEFRKLSVRVLLGQLMRDLAGVLEDVSLIELKESVELDHPIRHVHGTLAAGLIFGVI